MHRSSRKTTYAYVASALALTVVAWALAWWAVDLERGWRLAGGMAEARRLAVFFERNTIARLRYGDAYARMVRRAYLEAGPVGARAVMDDVPLDPSLVSHVTIIDAGGTPVFNSGYPLREGVNASDRDYFKAMLGTGDYRPHVSLPSRGRNSGRLILRLVRRISLADGTFGGVVFAAIDTEGMVEFFDAMNLGPLSSATLVGEDRRIRARSTYGRFGPGQDISGSRIWRELEGGPVGAYRQTSVVDGVSRYYAYRRLEDFPLVVAIGVAFEDMLSDAMEYRRGVVLVAILVTMVIVMSTIVIGRERSLAARLRDMGEVLERRFEARTAELEAVQHELLANERMAALGQLTGTVAHELRNPLNTITASTALIERRLREAGFEVGAAPERVQRSIERCDRIITELLDFARSQGLDARAVLVDEWLPEVLEDILIVDEIALETVLGSPGVSITMDAERVRRAIINLVDNARDAIAGSASGTGRITVSTRPEDGGVLIAVADTGEGIAHEQLGRVREPLFSTKSFGFGLGLPIVERVVEDHGGRLDIESVVGAGTTVTLWLPAKPHSA